VWSANLVRESEGLLVLEGVFDTHISHPFLGEIEPGTRSLEYYWTDRWYNVFRFSEPTGSFRNFYCNVNLPPRISGDSVTFIDLDIDLVVQRDFSYRILDEDEFAENAIALAYPADVINGATQALESLRTLIKKRDFPFNP
jgi:uncharacterized protein